MLISASYSVSGIRPYFSCSKTPSEGKIKALNFSDSSKLVRIILSNNAFHSARPLRTASSIV